jgi:hypothetical protein
MRMTILAAGSGNAPHSAIQVEFSGREANHFPNTLPSSETEPHDTANIGSQVVEAVPHGFDFGIG